MKKSEYTLEEALELYKELKSLHAVAKQLHTSHISLSAFFKENGVEIQNIGKRHDFSEQEIQNMITDYLNGISMFNISKKYGLMDKKLRKLFRERGIEISKWRNHVKKEKPKKVKIKKEEIHYEYKQCPYCSWKTTDVLNKSYAYQKHLIYMHEIDVKEHLEKYPEDEFYLKSAINRVGKIRCKICGKYLSLIDDRHLQKHGITKAEYIQKYSDSEITSPTTKEKLQSNYFKMINNDSWDRKSSNYEKEICDFLTENNIEFVQHERTILDGKEIDIFIPSCNVGIEFHGVLWHTEWFAKKDKNYHLDKLINCNRKGVRLIQIFEDEYVEKRDIVLSKLKRLLNVDYLLPKIMGRKCIIKEIKNNEADMFLEINHIQGFTSSSVYLGAFYENELIGVMTFLEESKDKWNLTRFATTNKYICQGLGGKLFKYFIKTYNPLEVKSFADRRWTLNEDDNLYIKLGFELTEILKPDYKYYYLGDNKPKRFHKFKFRKQLLHKKYNLPLTMTETEMVKELGYDRIWDCGLFKYVWNKET